MNASKVSYTLESTLDSVNKAEQTARDLAVRVGFEDEEADRISMAVREAAINAVLHGNRYDQDKRMFVAFETTPEAISITIRDEGCGLVPEEVPDPLAPENLLKQSGRGIFLIRAFMDEVHFRKLNPGTEITLIKHARGVDRETKEASK